jgi:hypothetical protein
VRYVLINKTVARSQKRFSVIGVTVGGQFEQGWTWCALAVLFDGIGFIELIVLNI